ncbi:MAG TPA: sugar phosphate isomerase/epimerase [Gaiellaceae bacterium]|nr:sugar phosphate isomerase/epimerase [Gaiellaceae bacterium]
MKLGVFTVVFGQLPLDEALDRVVELGLDAVEIGTGNYPGGAHCVDGLREAVASRGLEISALSCHGNPLHPDEAFARGSHETWRRTVELAGELGVDTVVCFSGCPGDGPSAAKPNWVTCAWPPDYLEVLEWQWAERAIPYWSEEARVARDAGVRIALEPHPGFLVYNPETALRLRDACGPEIGVNLDPSHFVWQGIDPLLAVRELGNAGAIFHVHAKDVYVDPHNTARNGVLDTKQYGRFGERSWTFRSVGYGQGEKFWRDFVSALRIVGYDGVLSIEHEDGLASVEEGLSRAVEVLRAVVLRETPSEMWWA